MAEEKKGFSMKITVTIVAIFLAWLGQLTYFSYHTGVRHTETNARIVRNEEKIDAEKKEVSIVKADVKKLTEERVETIKLLAIISTRLDMLVKSVGDSTRSSAETDKEIRDEIKEIRKLIERK